MSEWFNRSEVVQEAQCYSWVQEYAYPEDKMEKTKKFNL